MVSVGIGVMMPVIMRMVVAMGMPVAGADTLHMMVVAHLR